MQLKLDENLGMRGIEILRTAGHDVSTVVDQQLTSCDDESLLNICSAEGRALVTLDLDFSNPLRFPPGSFSGIAVLRLSQPASREELLATCHALAHALSIKELAGKLWIV